MIIKMVRIVIMNDDLNYYTIDVIIYRLTQGILLRMSTPLVGPARATRKSSRTE